MDIGRQLMGKAKRNRNKAKPIKHDKRIYPKSLAYFIRLALRNKND